MQYFYGLSHLPYFLAAIAAGLILWLIQRKDRQKIYLPLLKVLELPDRQVRRWTVVLPPLVPFLVSVALMALLLFASFGPYRHATVLSRSPAQKILVVVDLSPSVQAATSLTRYRQVLKDTYRKLAAKTSVAWLDSYRMAPMSFRSVDEMAAYVDTLSFHPWGVNLDNLLSHAKDFSDSSLLIFSDRDQNAWQNFAQQFGSDRGVWWHDLSPDRVAANIYVDAVTIKDDPDPAYLNLEYRLSRTAGLEARQVQLAIAKPGAKAEGDGATMRQTVSFARNRRSLTSSVALARADWASEDNAILAVNLLSEDSVALDNTRYFSVAAGGKRALLVTHQGGEKFIDSPVYSTYQSLKSLGFDVDLSYEWPRHDSSPTGVNKALGKELGKELGKLRTTSKSPLPYQLVVVVGFTDGFFSGLCRKDPRAQLSPATPLWVIDLSLNRQEQLASSRCRYLFPKVAARSDKGVQSSLRRNGYSEITPQLAVPTFARKRRASDTKLVIISNLTELHEVNYRLNVMFYYDLLRRSAMGQGALSSSRQVVALADGSSQSFTDLIAFKAQNVPAVESRLQSINEGLLPPRFSLDQIADSGVKKKKLIPDSTVVFRLVMIALIALSLIEATHRWQRNRLGHFAIWLALGLGLSSTALTSQGVAEVSLGLYKLPFTVDEGRYEALAKYVKTRTSLKLPKKAYRSETFDDALLSRPMIIAGSGSLKALTAAQKRKLSRWLLAGGILIADQMTDRSPLVAITNELVINGIWQDVSLDNELMRSFHLLPSLPICGGVTFTEFRLENRIAILTVPLSLSSVLLAAQPAAGCPAGSQEPEFYPKLFINILMTALTTDYKKDQIHLPEILKKLR